MFIKQQSASGVIAVEVHFMMQVIRPAHVLNIEVCFLVKGIVASSKNTMKQTTLDSRVYLIGRLSDSFMTQQFQAFV